MEENKPNETTEENNLPEDNGEGIQSEADEKIKQLNEDTERINKSIAENENAKARQKLGGVSEAGRQPNPKPKMTDTEYAEALERGEVNPLKEDGVI